MAVQYEGTALGGARTLNAVGVALLLFLFTHHAALGQDRQQHRILMLSGYNYTLPSATTLAEALRDRLLERAPRKIDINAEFLDLARAPDAEHEARMVTFLRERYARAQPHVVVALGSDALRFTLKHRHAFAPGIPVVFAGVPEEFVQSIQRPSDVTGTTTAFDINLTSTLDMAERLQPDARHLIVVAGSGLPDRNWQTVARTVIERREKKFETTYLFDRSFDELVTEVSRVPNDAIVILLTIFADRTGKTFIPVDAAATLAGHSSAPSYTPYVDVIGKGGFIGGSSQPLELVGRAAADMALAILDGSDPATITPTLGPSAYRANYKAMQRFDLSESKLPTGTTLLFKEPTVWNEHRNFVLAAFAVIALQSAFAGALLLERRWRRRTELLLAESEERMTFTAAAVNVGLWQFDPETGKFWATEHSRSMFGLPASAPLTRDTVVDAIHPEDRDAALATLQGATRTDLPGAAEVRIVWPDLQVRWVRISARAFPRAHRKVRQLSGTFIDITDQKAAEVEAALQRREVAHLTRVSVLGELSGAIAHEINQPLTAILFNAQAALHLLAQDAPDIEEARNALQDIVQEDNRAGQVIQRLKTLLKKGEGTRERVEFNELVNTTVALLNSELIGRGISVQVVLANDLPVTKGDPVQLQQVLINFIVNAMDAMVATPATERSIAISTRATAEGTEIVVRDHGTGVDALEQGRVFEPFFTTKTQGLGLGLSICSTIIEAHGGELSLTNNPGGGAEARFSLPAQEMLVAAQ